jgi:hypothetical protein
MAEIEKTEFEFPDEVEKNPRAGGRVVEPELEIVDDTPEKDRNRTLLSEPPEPVTEDELAKYTDQKLKTRLAHINKGYHEERRAKEVAQREREEAVRIAQSIIEENKRLQGSLATNQGVLLDQAKTAISKEIDDAKREYKQAYESGDTDAVLAAQEKLTEATIRADKVRNFKPPPLQERENVVQTLQQVPQQAPMDPKARDWHESNSWFGTDRIMTAHALAIHQELVESGVPASSERYYQTIDTDIRKRFPEAFESEEANTSQRRSNVSPATRSTAPRKVVLTQSQVNIAKRLGVPLELYARKVAEEMRK